MRNLILLLLRYGGFITFIVLELICLFLIVRYNRTQREIFFNSSNIFSGTLYKQVDDVTQYWNLTATADSLAAENARLRAQIQNIEKIYNTNIDSLELETDSLAQYNYIAARVINNSTTRNNNILTIEKGAVDGIVSRQGVINDKGVVGVVKSVNNRYSTVLSVLHRQVRLSVAVKKSNFIGTLAWRGNDPTIVKMEDVPKHAQLEVGDTIITSGYTTRFPRGIMVGLINNIDLDLGSNFYDIDVKLSNDLNNVKYVYAINNNFRKEQEVLEQDLLNDN